MRLRMFGTLIVASALWIGCGTEMNQTETGAVSGGVVGAGLGAIIGGATGNAGSGLAIGAAAGTAAGAGIGYEAQKTEDRIDAQEQVIQNREREIASNQTEIDSLRAMSSERIGFAAQGSSTQFPREYQPPVPNRYPQPSGFKEKYENPGTTKLFHEPSVSERSLVEPPTKMAAIERGVDTTAPSVTQPTTEVIGRIEPPETDRTALEHENIVGNESIEEAKIPSELPSEVKMEEETKVAKAVAPASMAGAESRADTTECKQALGEAKDGELADDISDKLFHVRRALRLCPGEPDYHNRLGELYVSLDRTSDAEYEFQQALSLDPEHGGAKVNLENLRKY